MLNPNDGKYPRYLKAAFLLSIITIVYNIAEGLVSTFFGAGDETIALFGFGVDSFVEVISGIGVAHMVWRMKRSGDVASRDGFERTALRVTGGAFYLLAAGLVFGGAAAVYLGARPETTVPGIIISAVSIATMWALYRFKVKYGTLLGSEAILADANCTKTCFYLSFILLGSSLLFEIFKIGYVDIAGGLGIAWYAFREGREAFGKSRSADLSCGCSCSDCN
jgi:divalent metal cation (Fe/Co/Zn/Cd) transporter